ncbi:hypothetical protein GW17_00026360 [Ensete ventricosum]|nr:hypothetical protein GW17_00026360 [Ensete ventricosum]RZS28758.1 hypothetical protein BHM03_00062398 [Ensete ventricosum]
MQEQRGGGVASHSQPPCKAGHPRPGRLQGAAGCGKAPCKGAVGHGQNPLAGVAANRRGRPRAWLALVGAAPTSVGSARGQAAGRPLAGATASRGSARARWLHPPTRCRPRAAALTEGAVAHADGVHHRRLRRCSDGDSAEGGK